MSLTSTYLPELVVCRCEKVCLRASVVSQESSAPCYVNVTWYVMPSAHELWWTFLMNCCMYIVLFQIRVCYQWLYTNIFCTFSHLERCIFHTFWIWFRHELTHWTWNNCNHLFLHACSELRVSCSPLELRLSKLYLFIGFLSWAWASWTHIQLSWVVQLKSILGIFISDRYIVC